MTLYMILRSSVPLYSLRFRFAELRRGVYPARLEPRSLLCQPKPWRRLEPRSTLYALRSTLSALPPFFPPTLRGIQAKTSTFKRKMAVETERKFLVTDEFIHQAVAKTEIVQTYLSIDPARIVRIRIAGDNKACLTIKSLTEGSLLSRKEWEFPVSIEEAREMMAASLPGKVVKTRNYIRSGKHMFEVDVFHDKNEGLVLAEIELSHPDEYFARPAWLGEEVTGNPAYYNSNLIK